MSRRDSPRRPCAPEHCERCHPNEDDPVRYLWNERDLSWEAEHPERVCLFCQTILAA